MPLSKTFSDPAKKNLPRASRRSLLSERPSSPPDGGNATARACTEPASFEEPNRIRAASHRNSYARRLTAAKSSIVRTYGQECCVLSGPEADSCVTVTRKRDGPAGAVFRRSEVEDGERGSVPDGPTSIGCAAVSRFRDSRSPRRPTPP